MPLKSNIKPTTIINNTPPYVAIEPKDEDCSEETLAKDDAIFDRQMNVLKTRKPPKTKHIQFNRSIQINTVDEPCLDQQDMPPAMPIMRIDTKHSLALPRVDRFFNELRRYLAENKNSTITDTNCLAAASEIGLNLKEMTHDKQLRFTTELHRILGETAYNQDFDDSDLVEEANRLALLPTPTTIPTSPSYPPTPLLPGNKPPHRVPSLNFGVLLEKKAPEDTSFATPTHYPPLPFLCKTQSQGTQTQRSTWASTAQNTDAQEETKLEIKP